MSQEFWDFLRKLVQENKVIIDRSKGSTHPRYPGVIYPVDYGYLAGTTSQDGGGVDIWVGTSAKKEIVGILGTVDLFKKDTELKIIFACTEKEIEAILEFTDTDQMKSIFIKGMEEAK